MTLKQIDDAIAKTQTAMDLISFGSPLIDAEFTSTIMAALKNIRERILGCETCSRSINMDDASPMFMMSPLEMLLSVQCNYCPNCGQDIREDIIKN